MDVIDQLHSEWEAIQNYEETAITINSTAREGHAFLVLPRRYIGDTAVAGFLIDRQDVLIETLRFFDGRVATIYVDVEQKKHINLFQTAKNTVKHSNLEAFKPNDMAVEACDMLVRQHYYDELEGKRIVIIGTGNLASKIALRLSERQAHVYILGRSSDKEQAVITGLNTLTPAYSEYVRSFTELPDDSQAVDAVIAFITGEFQEEDRLIPYTDQRTLFVDGGINNFSGRLIERLTANDMIITRLDVRLGLPYQFLASHRYITSFFEDVYGRSELNGVTIVAGGFIGETGSVIVDNVTRPGQIVGVADGRGGVKKHGDLTAVEQEAIRSVRDTISVSQ